MVHAIQWYFIHVTTLAHNNSVIYQRCHCDITTHLNKKWRIFHLAEMSHKVAKMGDDAKKWLWWLWNELRKECMYGIFRDNVDSLVTIMMMTMRLWVDWLIECWGLYETVQCRLQWWWWWWRWDRGLTRVWRRCIKLYKWLAFWELEKPTQLAQVLS